MSDIFAGPRLKIERANHHINDLNTRLAEFQAKKPFETVVRYDPERAERTLCRKTNESIPDQFALIIGDAVHNLRAALDLAIFGLIGARADNPGAVQFPFARNAERFKDAFAHRQISIAGEHVRRAVDELRPYGGGNDLLHGLHELDVADKHKLLVPVASIVGLNADDMRHFGREFDVARESGFLVFPNVETDVLVTVPAGCVSGPKPVGPVEQKTEFQPAFSICFGRDQPFTGRLSCLR